MLNQKRMLLSMDQTNSFFFHLVIKIRFYFLFQIIIMANIAEQLQQAVNKGLSHKELIDK
jgi:hypothetical protein